MGGGVTQEWTIPVCPVCFADEHVEPRDCEHCEEGGRLEPVRVVPRVRLEEAEAERDSAQRESEVARRAADQWFETAQSHVARVGELEAALRHVVLALNPTEDRPNYEDTLTDVERIARRALASEATIRCVFCGSSTPNDDALSRWIENSMTGSWCCGTCEHKGHSDHWPSREDVAREALGESIPQGKESA